jgi:hypothetical protein
VTASAPCQSQVTFIGPRGRRIRTNCSGHWNRCSCCGPEH